MSVDPKRLGQIKQYNKNNPEKGRKWSKTYYGLNKDEINRKRRKRYRNQKQQQQLVEERRHE